jgi:hypothetical protein
MKFRSMSIVHPVYPLQNSFRVFFKSFKLFQVQRRAQTIRPNDIGIGGERHTSQRNQARKTSLQRGHLLVQKKREYPLQNGKTKPSFLGSFFPTHSRGACRIGSN